MRCFIRNNFRWGYNLRSHRGKVSTPHALHSKSMTRKWRVLSFARLHSCCGRRRFLHSVLFPLRLFVWKDAFCLLSRKLQKSQLYSSNHIKEGLIYLFKLVEIYIFQACRIHIPHLGDTLWTIFKNILF